MSDVDLSQLDNFALRRHIAYLRGAVREAEAELWERTAILLAPLDADWADPSRFGLTLHEPIASEYLERVHEHLGRALPRTCRPGRSFPWTEVWGPVDALGPAPVIHLRALVAHAHELTREEFEDLSSWA